LKPFLFLGTCNTVHMVARDWVSRKLKEGILVPDFNLNLKPRRRPGEKHQVFPLFSLFFFSFLSSSLPSPSLFLLSPPSNSSYFASCRNPG